ncbi:MAG: ferrochelatase [Simkaniaceae bacterium]|nr:ferrochelatase [Simkaniaceae bacterium]
MIRKKGILLVNLGTPDSSHPPDVKKYLSEFLCDPRVIELKTPWRQALVRGVIIPKRYRSSAKMYEEIWMKEGSPLLFYSQKMKESLQKEMGEEYQVELAMRYQTPSIKGALQSLKSCQTITVIPLFPQYAGATTGSVHEAVMKEVSSWKVIPEMRFIQSYPTLQPMIEAFAERGRGCHISSFDEVIMSFHGLPISADYEGRYSSECLKTAEALASTLGLTQYHLSFQSRLGNKPWLRPYTSELIASLKGKKILVFCPAFVADCLETLYEIGIEYASEGDVTLVPSLNDHPLWIQGLKALI